MALTVEVEARNVEEAVKRACEKFDISSGEIKYDVISHGSSGIFGLGLTRNAKIRVQLPGDPNPDAQEQSEKPQSDGKRVSEAENQVHNLMNENMDPRQAPELSPGIEEQIGLGKQVLQRIVDAITSDATVAVDKNSERILFDVSGGNSALLIGKHGQTLEAMQSVVEKVVNKKRHERLRVQVDVEGYVENRKSSLIQQAERLADKCKQIRRPVTVGYMNAHDRRIVHLALKDDGQVRTRSTGDGYMRKLVIYPNKNAYTKRRFN